MPYLDREGVRIYYRSAGSGPAILLSHGYSATSQMWDAQIENLRHRYQVISWDFRGHGQSDYPDEADEYTPEKATADMAAILDACGVDRAIVGGLSLGGYMSLAFHLAHPERVRALLLFDCGPGYKNEDARARWNENAERRAERLEREGLAALGGGSEVRASQHRDARGLALAARGMLRQFDARVINSLPAVAVPTLVLVGALDEPFLGASDYMASKIPGAKKVVLESAGHAANLDQPEAFNRALDAYLATLEAVT